MIVIRMSRLGRTNRPHFRIGVYDVRTRRDGPPIEYLGHYDPLVKDDATKMKLDDERVRYWLSQGASVSETMASFLKRRGIPLPVRRKKQAKRRPKRAARATARVAGGAASGTKASAKKAPKAPKK